MSKETSEQPVLLKRTFLAEKEIMNKMEPLVDVVLNMLPEVVKVADKHDVDGEYLIGFVKGRLPFELEE